MKLRVPVKAAAANWRRVPWRWAARLPSGKGIRLDVATAQRAFSAALIAPSLFVVGDLVLGNTPFALFSALASLVMLLFVTHTGGTRERLTGHAGLLAVTSVLLCLGTAAARPVPVAVLATSAVSFVVLFSGAVSSQLARWSTAMLISFGLPATFPGGVVAIPCRLAGWLAAGAICSIAVAVSGRSTRGDLTVQAGRACLAVAERIQTEVRCSLTGSSDFTEIARQAASERATEAVTALRASFFGSPYWPATLGTAGRHLLQVIEHIRWLDHMLDRTPSAVSPQSVLPAVCAAQSAVAEVLASAGESLLGSSGGAASAGEQRRRLDGCVIRLNAAVVDLERAAAHSWVSAPERQSVPGKPSGRAAEKSGQLFIACVAPTFGTHQVSVAASAVAQGAAALIDDRRRGWLQRLLGLAPRTRGAAEAVTRANGIGSPEGWHASGDALVETRPHRLGAGCDGHGTDRPSERSARLRSHLTIGSTWFQNSLRGAVALGASVLIADLSGVSHQFWVVFGTLAVLRSSAAGTGLSAVQAIGGTVAGIATAGLFLWAFPVGPDLLWVALPLVVGVVAVTPPSSVAAAQAAFTLMLLVLFALVEPTGLDVGLLRLGDVALGAAVSVVVAVALWPQGAGGVLRGSAGAALIESASYLEAVLTHRFGPAAGVPSTSAKRPMTQQPDDQQHGIADGTVEPASQRTKAIEAGYRFDDAFRAYRVESRQRKVPMSEVMRLVSAAAYLTLTADAVGRIWSPAAVTTGGAQVEQPFAPEAGRELLAQVVALTACYRRIGQALAASPGGGALPEQQPQVMQLPRLAGEVLRYGGLASADDLRVAVAATRAAWTADLLHALWDLQGEVVSAGSAVR